MILYPTETLYALGVNALDEAALMRLYTLKERDTTKASSWLVRNMEDVVKYAVVPEKAAKIAERFLPGKLTLVLETLPSVSRNVTAKDGTIGFRISSDPFAQKTIEEFMEKHDAPLTCTSANVSGLATLGTVGEVQQQFGAKAHLITKIVDGGPRKGLASTVVRVIGDEVTILREGDISEAQIREVVG
jgi:L-threonylcarbamoyladenylate synthase